MPVPAAGDRSPTAAPTTPAGGRCGSGPAVHRHRAGHRVQAPDLLHVVGRHTARDSVGLHGRRELRRPQGPVPAARAQHQPAAARDHSGEPWRQHRRPAALQGLRRHPALRERGASPSTTASRSAPTGATRTASRWASRTRSASRRTTAATSATCCATPTTTRVLGHRRATTAATCSPSTTSTTCRSSGSRPSLVANLLGGWQMSGASFFRTGHAVLDRADQPGHRRRGRRALSASRGTSSATRRPTPTGSSRRAAPTRTSGSTPRRSPGRRPARSATRPRNVIYNPGEQQWDIALFKNFDLGGTRACSCAPSSSTSRTTRTSRTCRPATVEQRSRGGPDQRQLRPRDQQDGTARHSAERAVPVLGRRFAPPAGGWGLEAGGGADRSKPGGSILSPGEILRLFRLTPLTRAVSRPVLQPDCD